MDYLRLDEGLEYGSMPGGSGCTGGGGGGGAIGRKEDIENRGTCGIAVCYVALGWLVACG